MQKRTGMFFPPVRGTIEKAEMTDRGVRYIGTDSGGNDVSVDANNADTAVNLGGRLILVEGAYLERDDNGRKYLIRSKDGVYIDFSVAEDGRFILKYGRGTG